MAIISTDINKAIEILNNSKVIAIPTETVYGLAGNAYDESAIKLIFEIKKRPHYNPLIVHISNINQLVDIAIEIPTKAKLLAEKFWPGPLTLVLKKNPKLSPLLTSQKETVAVRIPDHDITLNLLSNLNYPLAAPSANSFGFISPTNSKHVQDDLGDKIDYILEGGQCTVGIESTIVGFVDESAIIYRQGSISVEEIEKVIGEVKVKTTHVATSPEAPGMLLKHYSPITKTYISDDVEESIKNLNIKKLGLLLFKSPAFENNYPTEILSSTGNLKEAAKNLYDAMHRLDSLNLEAIIAEMLPEEGLGLSINDKLKRASVD